MPLKSGLGRQDDFFKKSKIPKIQNLGQLRPSDRVSPYIHPNTDLAPKEDCGNLHITDNPNLMILGKGGREVGDLVLYDPVQQKNYLSQFARYERSLELLPSAIFDRDGKTYYRFCTSNSPDGYWEVVVGDAGATYLYFTKPFLTIICPRPFRMSELTSVETDSTVFKWSQIAGNRTVLVEPGDIEDPLIIIENTCYTGNCDPGSTQPLTLQLDTDNELVFDRLYIYNQLIDNFYGLGFNVYTSDKDCLKILSATFAPLYTHKAYTYTGGMVRLTWSNPTCDVEYLVDTVWQVNTTGQYVDLQQFFPSGDRSIYVTPNTHYRVVTNFKIYGRGVRATGSPIYFSFDSSDTNKLVFADDSFDGLGFVSVGATIHKLNLSVKTFETPADSTTVGLGFVKTGNFYHKINLQSHTVDVTADTATEGVGFTKVSDSYHKVNLGGIVIG